MNQGNVRGKLLIVDDVEVDRKILAAMLENDYQIMEAEDGRQAIELLQKYHDEILVVLLDLIMDGVDGYAVLEAMREHSWLDKIPVLVISVDARVNVERRCFKMGVSDFIHKPFDNAIVENRVRNVIELFLYKNKLEAKVGQQTEWLKKQNEMLARQAEKLRKRNNRLTDILGTVVEFRNLESGEHIKRVKGFARILAEEAMQDYPEYGLTEEMIDIIESASVLHDIGKIAIPDGILLKPGRLTRDEYEYMKLHTTKGCEILDNIQDLWSETYGKTCYEICRHHHERYDGKGYPDGLAGEEIPISAQLVSVADVYDALVSERVYKDAYSLKQAHEMILAGECGVFSPKLMACFEKVRKKFEALAEEQKTQLQVNMDFM